MQVYIVLILEYYKYLGYTKMLRAIYEYIQFAVLQTIYSIIFKAIYNLKVP